MSDTDSLRSEIEQTPKAKQLRRSLCCDLLFTNVDLLFRKE